jgi:transcriptional regulator with XRE-family HTH domain|nr:MAG TPA: Repressor protein CI [Caudoviricetes sp.]
MYEIYQKLRDERGLKDSDVAREASVSKSTFSDWKVGRSKPGIKKLQKIADFFGVTVDYLMTGKEEDKKEKDNSVIDIKDELERMRDLLKNRTRHPIYYDGEKLDDESLDAILAQYEMSLIYLKQKNK